MGPAALIVEGIVIKDVGLLVHSPCMHPCGYAQGNPLLCAWVAPNMVLLSDSRHSHIASLEQIACEQNIPYKQHSPVFITEHRPQAGNWLNKMMQPAAP